MQLVQANPGIQAKKQNDADIVLSAGQAGDAIVRIVEVPKDPSKSHPFRQKEIVEKVRLAAPDIRINQ